MLLTFAKRIQLLLYGVLSMSLFPLSFSPFIPDRINSFGDDVSLMRTIVRLAFHDAMGGVDGTLNFNDPEHNGLAQTVGVLDDLWNSNGQMLSSFSSKADFFAW